MNNPVAAAFKKVANIVSLLVVVRVAVVESVVVVNGRHVTGTA